MFYVSSDVERDSFMLETRPAHSISATKRIEIVNYAVIWLVLLQTTPTKQCAGK